VIPNAGDATTSLATPALGARRAVLMRLGLVDYLMHSFLVINFLAGPLLADQI
jgi:hypothetical protein